MSKCKIILVAALSLFLTTAQAQAPEPTYKPSTVESQCGASDTILRILEREFMDIVVVGEGPNGNVFMAVRDTDGWWSMFLNPKDRPDVLCLIAYGESMRYL